MAGRDPTRLAALVLEALQECGQRGLLLSGWGGMRAMAVPETVCVVDSAPHGWLFPRMAAVVHHGGAGTTAEGLRAGVPTVIVPFIVDQHFWGARVEALGLGPGPLPRKKLTASKLASAIDLAVNDPRMKEAAGATSRAIRAEDGVSTAIAVINKVLE
jgi:UDP:flavonoid glycosyltransferase YjiC (YdhE family)